LTRLCAWCGATLPPHPGDEDEGGKVSHGICEKCLDAISVPESTDTSEVPHGDKTR
jgi:hypothetical protein